MFYLFQCKILAKVKYFTENIFILQCLVCIPENAKKKKKKKMQVSTKWKNFNNLTKPNHHHFTNHPNYYQISKNPPTTTLTLHWPLKSTNWWRKKKKKKRPKPANHPTITHKLNPHHGPQTILATQKLSHQPTNIPATQKCSHPLQLKNLATHHNP